MKKIVFSVLLSLYFAANLFAIDEDTYVRFVADSIITAYKVKGNPDAETLWVNEMRSLYPDVTSEDITSFETSLEQNSDLKTATYDRILEDVKSKGYNAHISGTNARTTVIIED